MKKSKRILVLIISLLMLSSTFIIRPGSDGSMSLPAPFHVDIYIFATNPFRMGLSHPVGFLSIHLKFPLIKPILYYFLHPSAMKGTFY